VGRLQRFLLYRKCAAFDFTMLGPRVPAVVISPRIRAGTVDVQTHDHASIPATLRALFAPHARPLTERDNWAAPFHELCTLPEARADLPDLSAHATGLTSAISAPRAAVAAADTEPTAVPAYYEPFLAQAAQVQQHLAVAGEPEMAIPATGPPADRGAQITRQFAAAADRHRGAH
jgi:phospholipase C